MLVTTFCAPNYTSLLAAGNWKHWVNPHQQPQLSPAPLQLQPNSQDWAGLTTTALLFSGDLMAGKSRGALWSLSLNRSRDRETGEYPTCLSLFCSGTARGAEENNPYACMCTHAQICVNKTEPPLLLPKLRELCHQIHWKLGEVHDSYPITGANTLQCKAATAAVLALCRAVCALWKSCTSKITSSPCTSMVQVVVTAADYMLRVHSRRYSGWWPNHYLWSCLANTMILAYPF